MQKKEITKAKSRYFINAGLVIVLGLVLLPREVRAASHALLIGIGDYSRSGIESLSGPPNDVTIMRDVLMRRFAVPESNIMVLRDSQATHSKISAAFGERFMHKSKCVTLLKVLGDQTRWSIVAELLRAPRTVGELTQKLKVSQYNISKHIRTLREAGIIETQRKGQFMKCSVKRHLHNTRKKSRLDLGCCTFQF